MQIHQIKPKNKPKTKKRIGRGGKRGTYSGRGMKGQSSRAGRKFQPIIREFIKRYPKLRGYRFNPKEKKEVKVNLLLLVQKFKAGERITPRVLIKRKIIRKIKDRVPEVKILGSAQLKKKLIVENCKVSKGAREKI